MALARLTEQLAMRDSVPLEQNYAMLLLENQQPREAVTRLRDLRERRPDLPSLALAEARVLRSLGARNLAEPILLELFAHGYETDQVREELGRIAARRGEWLEAVEWHAGIDSEALAPAATQGLVQAFVELGEYAEALAAVTELARRQPQHRYESLPLAASVMQSAGRWQDALAAYDEGLRYLPESRQLRLARAGLLADMNRHRRAIRAMEELLEDYPRDSDVLNALGYTLADRGIRLEEAHDHISLALELAPGSPAIVDSMGWGALPAGQGRRKRCRCLSRRWRPFRTRKLRRIYARSCSNWGRPGAPTSCCASPCSYTRTRRCLRPCRSGTRDEASPAGNLRACGGRHRDCRLHGRPAK